MASRSEEGVPNKVLEKARQRRHAYLIVLE